MVKRFVIELDRAVLTAKVAGTGQRMDLLRLGARKAEGRLRADRAEGRRRQADRPGGQALERGVGHRPVRGRPLIGEATVNAKIGDADNGKDNHDDKGDDRNDD